MKSKTGALLTKIAAIINLVVAGLVFLLGITALIGLGLYQGQGGMPLNLGIMVMAISLIGFVLGFLLLNAAEKMKSQKTVKNGGIWAIVIGVITLTNITGIIALIGGILAVLDADKKK